MYDFVNLSKGSIRDMRASVIGTREVQEHAELLEMVIPF